MKEQKKREIIKKLNDLKMRINWWCNFLAEKVAENNKKEENQARIVINSLCAEYAGMQYVLYQFGWEIEIGNDNKVEGLSNY